MVTFSDSQRKDPRGLIHLSIKYDTSQPIPSQSNDRIILTTMPSYLHYLVLLLTSVCFLPWTIISAKQPSPEAIEHAKYIQGIVKVAFLPEDLKPSKTPENGVRRLLFIGDVHGAYNELVSLLEVVKYKSSRGILPTFHAE
jgi:hypothetical protein